MIRPTPASTARAQLGGGLVVAVVADPGRVEAGPQRDGQLAAGADVEAEPLLGDPARDRRCTGTPCRRRRRRTPANASRKRAARRARKSASSRTYAGEPCSATSSRSVTPPTSSTPSSSLRAVERPQLRHQRVGVGGLRAARQGRAGARRRAPSRLRGRAPRLTSARGRRRRAGRGRWRARCGWRRPAAAGPRAGRSAPRRPSAAPGRCRRTGGSAPAVLLEVARHPVRLAQLGRGGDHPRELGERARAASPSFSCASSAGSKPSSRRAARGRGRRRCAGSRQPGVGVLHVEDRVVAGLLGPQVEVDVDGGVGGVAGQRVAARRPRRSPRPGRRA